MSGDRSSDAVQEIYFSNRRELARSGCISPTRNCKWGKKNLNCSKKICLGVGQWYRNEFFMVELDSQVNDLQKNSW
jgi:hypothetical protein